MSEVSNFVSNVGFPIAIACGTLYIVYKASALLIAKAIEVFDGITSTNKELAETNKMLAEGVVKKMDRLDEKMDSILVEIKK